MVAGSWYCMLSVPGRVDRSGQWYVDGILEAQRLVSTENP